MAIRRKNLTCVRLAGEMAQNWREAGVRVRSLCLLGTGPLTVGPPCASRVLAVG